MSAGSLALLAEAAGLLIDWEDVHGTPRTVSYDTLLSVLAALGWPAETPAQREDSLQRCLHGRVQPALRTVQVGELLALAADGAAEWSDEQGQAWPARQVRPGAWEVPAEPG